MRRRADKAGIVIAVALFALALAIWRDTAGMQVSPFYGIGPEAVPVVVAVFVAILAAANLVLALRGDFPEREAVDPRALGFILGGIAAVIGLIWVGAGFIPATGVLFAATAAGFGRRAFATDLAIGLVLAFVVFLLFDKLLDLSLPAGPIERLF